MGKYVHQGVECYRPDSDENTLYLLDSLYTIDGLRQQIIEHFSVSADEADQDFVFSTENIHTHCLGYDGYDAGDWTQFIVIRRK